MVCAALGVNAALVGVVDFGVEQASHFRRVLAGGQLILTVTFLIVMGMGVASVIKGGSCSSTMIDFSSMSPAARKWAGPVGRSGTSRWE